MLEMMTASAKKSDLPEPTGDIQGIVQNMGIVTNMPYTRDTDEFTFFGSLVYVGFAARTGTGSATSSIYTVDVESGVAKNLSVTDHNNLLIGRFADIDPSGRYLTLYGGLSNSNPSVCIADVVSNTRPRGDFSFGYNLTQAAHAGYNDKYFIIGPANSTAGYKITYPRTGTKSSSVVSSVNVSSRPDGYVGCAVGNRLYVKSRASFNTYVFNMDTETITTLASAPTSFSSFCSGVYDGSRYIYWLSGTAGQVIQGVRRFDVTTNTWDSSYGDLGLVLLTGQKPTSTSYATKGTKLIWYNQSIYFFRTDTNTPEGRTLYRII